MNPWNDAYVLDASGLVAMLRWELGRDVVEDAIERGCAMSTVNVAEVVSGLCAEGIAPILAQQQVGSPLPLTVYDFDQMHAYQAGFLRPRTRSAGLSLGDRACIALAQALRLPVLTADRVWATLDLDVTVQLIR